jgi:hypothetical protein
MCYANTPVLQSSLASFFNVKNIPGIHNQRVIEILSKGFKVEILIFGVLDHEHSQITVPELPSPVSLILWNVWIVHNHISS